MARNTKTAVITRNLGVDAEMVRCNSGKLRFYTTPQPADSDTAISTQTLLAELTYGATAYGAASGGVANANAITSDSSADATGTAVWCRHTTSAGLATHDSTVGSSALGDTLETHDMLMNSTAIQIGALVSCTGCTYTLPA